MPNAPRNTAKAVRIDDELWATAGRAVEAAGSDRSAVIRQFLRWYVREPGVLLPQRPGDNPRTDPRDDALKEVHALLQDALDVTDKYV